MALLDPAVRSAAGKSGSAVKTEPAQHLIQHVKQTDPMLFEYLSRLGKIVNESTTFGNQTTIENPPAVPTPLKPGPFHRTLLLKDTTVGNNIADEVPAQYAGTIYRCIAVLRKTIASNLVVRINKNALPIITVTIPSTFATGTSMTIPVNVPVTDEDVFSFDVTASDGSSDVGGIASITVEWQ